MKTNELALWVDMSTRSILRLGDDGIIKFTKSNYGRDYSPDEVKYVYFAKFMLHMKCDKETVKKEIDFTREHGCNTLAFKSLHQRSKKLMDKINKYVDEMANPYADANQW